MRNSTDLRNEIELLTAEARAMEYRIVDSAKCYKQQVKSLFGFASSASACDNGIRQGAYAYNNNLATRLLQGVFRLASPFFIALLTPRTVKWYAPIIAKLIDYVVRTLGCLNYGMLFKFLLNSAKNKKGK